MEICNCTSWIRLKVRCCAKKNSKKMWLLIQIQFKNTLYVKNKYFFLDDYFGENCICRPVWVWFISHNEIISSPSVGFDALLTLEPAAPQLTFDKYSPLPAILSHSQNHSHAHADMRSDTALSRTSRDYLSRSGSIIFVSVAFLHRKHRPSSVKRKMSCEWVFTAWFN